MASSFVFGERAVINLFRGAGGLLGSSGGGASGMDSLNARLQEAFDDYFWVSQVHSSYEGDVFNFREVGSQSAQVFTNQLDQIQALGVVGYSAGGLSAIRFAPGRAPEAVNLSIQIDSFDPLTGSSREDEVLPENVIKGINYYQSANRFNPFAAGFDPLDLQGATRVEGAENINAESLFNDRSITHRNIEDNPSVQNQILQDIEQYVLQDLKFDRAHQLALSGGSQQRNNILTLKSGPNGEDGGAFIRDVGNIGADFSFQSRFEFRLPPRDGEEPPGLSFLIQPAGNFALGAAQSSLTVTFEPFSLDTLPAENNAVGIFTPDLSAGPLAYGAVNFDLDNGLPLTTWVDYDGFTNQLSVFVNNTLTKPTLPVASLEIELSALTGPQASFGFESTVEGDDRSADLLTWQLTATQDFESPQTTAVVDRKRLPFDYNGDKKSDLPFFRTVVNEGTFLGEVGIWLLDGLGPPVEQSSVDRYPFSGNTDDYLPVFPLRNLDFNGDGKTDFLFSRSLGEEGFELGGWLLDGTKPVEQASLGTVSSAWDIPLNYTSFAARLPQGVTEKGAFGDFNGDRKTDILWLRTNIAGNRELGLWLMDGVTPVRQVSLGDIGSAWLPINLNDFNGDGRDDILFERILNDGGVEYGIWLMDGVTPTLQQSIGSIAAGEEWKVIDTNDFNRDGKADILFSRNSLAMPEQVEYALWLMDGTTFLEQKMIGEAPADHSLIDHNDFNGDGKADLLFRRPTGNEEAEYSVWLMDGSSVISDSVLDVAPASWTYLMSADINGDGRADLVFVDDSMEATVQVYGWLMDGTSVSAQGTLGLYDSADSPGGWLPPFAAPELAVS